MSEPKVNVVTPMIMNLDSTWLSQDELSFVLNAVREGFIDGKPFLTNVGGTELEAELPAGYEINGKAKVGSRHWVLFLANEGAGLSQIGILRNGMYEPVVEDAGLGFRMNAPIQAKAKILYNGSIVTYWTDGVRPMRAMNLSRPPFLNGALDLDQIRIFKNYQVAQLEVTGVSNNGILPTAGIYLTAQYADLRGTGMTAWFDLTPKVPIYHDSVHNAYEMISGNVAEVPTNKAIKLRISNPDLSFTHLNIGAIHVINGSIRSFKVATISIQQEEYIYTGAGEAIPTVLEEMLVPPTVYETAKTVDESDGSLVWGNLKGKKPLNLQPYISQIQMRWVAYRAKGRNRDQSGKNPVFAAYMSSYRRDEVAPLALIIRFTDGTETNPLPLVGRKADHRADGEPIALSVDYYGQPVTPGNWDSQVVTRNNNIYETDARQRWQVYNTATVEGNMLAPGVEEGLSYYGELGYWESTERYPNNPVEWGDLAGTPYRFPRLPDSSVLHIHDGENGQRGINDDVYVYHMGIDLPNIEAVFAAMPADVRSLIADWRVVRADRSFDKSVEASGLLFNCLGRDFSTDPNVPPDVRLVPNYPLNDLRPEAYVGKNAVRAIVLDQSYLYNYLNDVYYKNTFTFLSPDTTLERTALAATELKINAELYGKGDCFHNWLEPYPAFKERDGKATRCALNGVALGWYNNYKKPSYANVRRRLDESMYIPANAQVSGGNAGKVVWNKGRESTVLLKTHADLANPSVQDRSRFILNNQETDVPATEQFKANQDGDESGITAHVNRPVSAYYVTLKRNIPNQYGSLSNIKYVDTGYNKARFQREGAVFGGDTYIGMFSAKRQRLFYDDIQKWMYNGDEMKGANFKATMNVPGTIYYYKNTGGNPRNNSNTMMKDGSGWFLGDDKDLGFLTMYMQGVPVYWAEADINHNLRHEGTQSHEAYYPSLLKGAVSVQEWLGVANIDKDNAFTHNTDLTKPDNFKNYRYDTSLYEPDNSALSEYYSRAIKSLRSQPEDLSDNWQVYKPLDYYDFPKSRGPLEDVRYLGQTRTAFRFRGSLYITQLLNVAQTNNGGLLLGQGRLFTQDPTEAVYSEVNYTGTQSQFAFEICEFGAFFVNAERGKVFNIASGIQDITSPRHKVENWMARHLPFKLSQDIPGVPTDRPFGAEGVGIHTAYDAVNKLFIITKKDYELIDKTKRSQFSYEGVLRYNGQVVSVLDRTLFANRSFTIAYSPQDNGWLSFYSFLPDFYLSDEDTFRSTVADAGRMAIHAHNSRTRFNHFYGKRQPFVIEYATKTDGLTTTAHTATAFICKAYGLRNDDFYELRLRTFNKAVVYNSFQCSGLLQLIVQDENDLSTYYQMGTPGAAPRQVAIRSRDERWSFSDYFDIAKGNGPLFLTDWANLKDDYYIDKVLNEENLDYKLYMTPGAAIRGQVTKTRLILDDTSEVKLLFQVGLEVVRGSYG